MFFLETSQFPVSMWSTTLVKKSPECAYRLSRLEIVFMHAHAHKQTHTQIYIYICASKPSVSSSLKLSYVTFKLCISCRRTALPAATNDFERVHFAWQVRCFAMVVKISISFSVAGVRDSHVFFCDCLCFFSWFMVVRCAYFFFIGRHVQFACHAPSRSVLRWLKKHQLYFRWHARARDFRFC